MASVLYSAEALAGRLDRLFPTGGREEKIEPIRDDCDELAELITEVWDSLPQTLQKRIQDIELEVCKREPFALRILPWVTIEILDDLG